jgi:hypothetical protein
MVHDEMATVPQKTATPPPCKKEQNKRESPIGAMGRFSRSLQHVRSEVDRSVCSCASVSQGKHVSHFPIGAMGFCRRGWRVLLPGRTKDRSQLKDESRLGGSAGIPIGAMGKFNVSAARTF